MHALPHSAEMVDEYSCVVFLFVGREMFVLQKTNCASLSNVEITNAVIWILFFDLAHPIQTGFLCMGYSLLAAVAWIDYLHFIIHNILLIVSFLCLAIAVIAVDFVWQYHVLGMIFCPGFIWLVSWAIKLVKKREKTTRNNVKKRTPPTKRTAKRKMYFLTGI